VAKTGAASGRDATKSTAVGKDGATVLGLPNIASNSLRLSTVSFKAL
jgi:hypothetical protein